MPYRFSFNFGTAERTTPGLLSTPTDAAGHPTVPRRGYVWWFWLPTLRYNGGRPHQIEVLDLTLSWLCYWCSVTAWPKLSFEVRPWFHSSQRGLSTEMRLDGRHSATPPTGGCA